MAPMGIGPSIGNIGIDIGEKMNIDIGIGSGKIESFRN
jgi:hypothetical protein